MDVEKIVVLEPTCASMIKIDYPKLFMYFEDKEWKEKARKVAEKITDPISFLYSKDKLKEKLKKLNIKTTYHDPCHLKRTLKIKEEPREFLSMTTNFREMEDADRCCGNGGTFSLDYRDTSLKIASRKVKGIVESKADYLITSCSACIMQLADILSLENKKHIKIKHLLEIINEALEAKDES